MKCWLGRASLAAHIHLLDGHAYCQRDYHAMFSIKCARCNGTLVADCVEALGKHWHAECFVCEVGCPRHYGECGGGISVVQQLLGRRLFLSMLGLSVGSQERQTEHHSRRYLPIVVL